MIELREVLIFCACYSFVVLLAILETLRTTPPKPVAKHPANRDFNCVVNNLL